MINGDQFFYVQTQSWFIWDPRTENFAPTHTYNQGLNRLAEDYTVAGVSLTTNVGGKLDYSFD